jgi:preprotein translocase subunit YajC
MNLATVGLPLAQASQPVEQTATTTESGATPGKLPASQPAPWYANQFFPLILAMLFLYLFVFRNKSKTEKQRVSMLNALKKGDRIQTIGGILGTVVEARDDEVVVKVDESSNTKITFSRNAIHRVREEDKK